LYIIVLTKNTLEKYITGILYLFKLKLLIIFGIPKFEGKIMLMFKYLKQKIR